MRDGWAQDEGDGWAQDEGDGWAQDEGDGWAQDEGRTAHLVWVLTRGVERYRITARGGA